MTTPAMGLTLPVVGVTPGATAGTNIVDNFNIIDVHDHSSGKGVQVPAAGLNINAALSFGNQKAFNMSFLQLTSQVASPVGANDRPNVHVLNGDLYYTNASGTAVQITNAGSISGTSGSIGGLASPASAQFATNTFSWKADATTFAKQSFSDLQIYPFNSGATNFLTFKVSNSVTTWTTTWPDAAPLTTEVLNMTSGGVVSTISYDNIGSAMSSTGANAIATSMTSIGADAITADLTSTGANSVIDKYTRTTGTSVGARGVAISSGTANGTTITSTTIVSITGLSCTITTSGRPVFMFLIPVGVTGGDIGKLGLTASSAVSSISAGIIFRRDSTDFSRSELRYEAGSNFSSGNDLFFAPGAACAIDTPVAGTYTYSVRGVAGTASSSLEVSSLKLVVFEL